ncbi:MAG: hypothetical protein C5B49_15215 [Bdellovibrio sp.]|nr:MAG: hypothetical protein C5B49_15215 [Bdellovibrio sp.]
MRFFAAFTSPAFSIITSAATLVIKTAGPKWTSVRLRSRNSGRGSEIHLKFVTVLTISFWMGVVTHAQVEATTDKACPEPVSIKFVLDRTINRSKIGYTQGLIFDGDRLLESTGRFPASPSVINSIELATGRVRRLTDTPDNVFGEGLARIDSEIFQLSNTEGKIFVYDVSTLRLKKTMINSFSKRGWGLTKFDSKTLLASDGSENLYFIDAETLALRRTLPVTMGAYRLPGLNHLQMVGDSIFANLLESQYFSILRIDGGSGCVTGLLDVAPLLKNLSKSDLIDILTDPERVLNGIAYDPKTRQFYVTGKAWPRIFVIRLMN